MSVENLSPDLPEAIVDEPGRSIEDEVASSRSTETALTVVFTVAAVLSVSFVAVATGIV